MESNMKNDNDVVNYSEDPKNLDEAVFMLESKLDNKGKNYLKNNEPDWFFGMNLRNRWHMWHKESPLAIYFNSIGIEHPDDMYGTIISALKSKLNEEPFDLEGKVQFYKKYWDSSSEEQMKMIL